MTLISFIVLLAVILWINGIIPKQIAKVSSNIYLKKNFSKMQLEYVNIEWVSSFGDYIITFKDEDNKLHNFCIGPKYFPINLGQGIFGFEEEYKEKYNEQNENANINNIDIVNGSNSDTQNTTFTKTYNVLNVADSNDENYLYLTIKQFQEEEVKTVKVQRSLANTVEKENNYEFTFRYTNNIVEDNIESIFANTALITINKTDKQGLDQIQDIIEKYEEIKKANQEAKKSKIDENLEEKKKYQKELNQVEQALKELVNEKSKL